MDQIKDDAYYLEKIVLDLKFVLDNTKNVTIEELENNPILVDSILFRIVQISENNSKLSPSFKQVHRDIPWAAIKGMRNLIVHDYGQLRLTIVYDTIKKGMPYMYERLIEVTSD